jgi:lipopolysaccharide transport system permease protein
MSIKYVKEILNSPVQIVKNLYIYRHILWQMVMREIKGRFAGSMGGFLWNFVHPILLLGVYLFVFVYIFKLRIGTESGSGVSTVYLMAGLFPWLIMVDGLSKGTSSLIENATLIQKTSFPIEILISKAVLAPLLSHGIAIVILTLYKVIFGGAFVIIFMLPVIILLQTFFILGLAFLTATASVFFRDVIQFVQVLLSFGMYLSPIVYPLSMLPKWAHNLMYLNPAYPVISLYHFLFVNGNIVDLTMLYLTFFWASLFFLVGAFIFNKLKYEFADWL